MRYIYRVPEAELREKYDIIAGWGNSPLELSKRITASDINLRYIVNGENQDIGQIICGAEIISPGKFANISAGKKVLFVLFTNLESLLLRQINDLFPDADTIVSRLIDMKGAYRGHTYSRDFEDVILLKLIQKLNFPKDFPYMDIGVCHPVVRNNTYLLYESGYTNGVLVEPNPEMMELAEEYRPLNTRINGGAGAKEGVLPYVRLKSGGKAGLNHFNVNGEKIDTEKYVVDNMPVYEINHIMQDMCDETPWVLDIDCEQMDLDIICTIDFERFPVKIICVERDRDRKLYSMLSQKGYIHYADTLENLIFVRKDIFTNLYG